jgi:circadian clock protein KaiC
MTADVTEEKAPAPIQTGIEGLDEVLYGGVTPNRLSLIEGSPGSGKTTLALRFLLEGVRRGEVCMFVTLSESEEELRASAASHGWTLDGIEILELIASEESLKPDARYSMYHPSEVELGQTTRMVLAAADRIKPVRLVFDSLSEFRLLAEQPLRYRRQILALKQYFARRQCTVLFIDDLMSKEGDMHLHSLAHLVVSLEQHTPEYGSMRRRLRVRKLRGRAFREGYHDFIIRHDGLEVFPRLVAAEHRASYAHQTVKSGLEPLDALLGGGLAKGTSTLILGPAGTGKSSLATQFAWAAAVRGEHAVLFLLDESMATFRERTAGLGMDIESMISAGRMSVRQVDPAELSPGEFAHALRRTVEHDQTSVVVIDSLNGYLNAMPSERFLTLHMHELLSFLGQRGVTTLIPMTQHGIVGDMPVPVDASYLTDTVLLLRHFEAFGQIRQAISVMKKRTGKHERTVREWRIDNGILVGETLRDFQGILTGVPHFTAPIAGSKEDGR